MPIEDREEPFASAKDAISTVAKIGIKRNRPIKRINWLIVLLAILFVCVSGIIVLWIYLQDANIELDRQRNQGKPAKWDEKTTWPVAVLLPQLDGKVKLNAQRQWAGFELAFEENGLKNTNTMKEHSFQYEFDFKGDASDRNRDLIIQEIENRYGDGTRIFIITMSAAALEIKKKFGKLSSKAKYINDPPILIATVASAPDIANSEEGIYRHYIRSEDESGILATYIESINAKTVGIFHVTDSYGENAKDDLKKRLSLKIEIDSDDVHGIRIPTDERQADINAGVDNFLKKAKGDENAVAVIIGYGDMIKNTLMRLKRETKFEGKILVVSTFTEEEWRPELEIGEESFANRIRYIGPHTESVEDNKDYRGVVFQFTYLTLDRALQCKDQRGIEDFWDCFTTVNPSKTGRDWEQVEFTTNGDSYISLRLLEVKDN